MSDIIDYGTLMHDAMRSLIQKVLSDVAEHGLPGAHHFFITFDTTHEDAQLADWLRERYPAEMTVVMQHWFENLEVTDDGFSVTLNFGDAPEPLYIPYDAIQTFVDPSVEFGLKFETTEHLDDDDEEEELLHSVALEEEEDAAEAEEASAPEPHKADVVSLDQFRK